MNPSQRGPATERVATDGSTAQVGGVTADRHAGYAADAALQMRVTRARSKPIDKTGRGG
jgi:hypothetical protein